MNKIPKCRSKYFIPQVNNLKIAPKDSFKEHLVPKITQKNLKFSSNRQFGKDLTNSMKENINNIYNNHNTKIVSIIDKKPNNNNRIYIKKHSSASQVTQKEKKIKIALNERKLRENKSGSIINQKSDISNSEYLGFNNIKKDNILQPGGSKLHSSISFGINYNNKRPISTSNCISVRLSNPKNNNNILSSLNNRSINMQNNNIYAGFGNNTNNNNKIEMTHSNLDLM